MKMFQTNNVEKTKTHLKLLKFPVERQVTIYRGADKSLAEPRRKQVDVSVRMA